MIAYKNKADYLEFDLFGDVGESWFDDTITVDKVRNILNDNKNKPLLFNISSLGGDVFEALTIHDILKFHKAETKSRIIGATASSGTVLALGTDKVEMSPNALFLIHNVWGLVIGNANELREEAENMDKIDEILVNVYQKRANKNGKNKKKSQIYSLMEQEKWINADEAKAWGFIDEITNVNKIAAKITLNNQLPELPKIYLNKYTEMGLFNNKQKDAILNTVKTADGSKSFVYEGEELKKGTVLNLIGAKDSIEGEHTLENDMKIVIDAENKITSLEKIEAQADEPVTLEVYKEDVLNAVQEAMKPIFAKFEEIEDKFNSLKINGSTKKPMQIEGVNNSSKVTSPLDAIREARKQAQVEYKNSKSKK